MFHETVALALVRQKKNTPTNLGKMVTSNILDTA